MIRRIMTPYYLLGQDKDYPTVDPSALYVLATTYQVSLGATPPARDVRRNHASLIRELGSAGTVLLKNTNSTLPISSSTMNIAVFGNDAADPTDGLKFASSITSTGVDIGTQDVGGGSGSGRHTTLISPLEAIKARASKTGARVQYITSNTILSKSDFTSIYPIPSICLVFLKTYASEGFDRTSLNLDWNANTVVANVASLCPKTVVITHSAGINTLPFATNPNVTAILAAHYPGEQSGNSIVDILFGDVNPSGHLPYTIPKSEQDYDIPITNLTNTNVTDPNAWQADFEEGMMIDYRHFDAKNITPLYEFGFGLSYTTFSLSSALKVTPLYSKSTPLSSAPANLTIKPGGNPDLWTPLLSLKTSISNTGSVVGASVVQLYISLPQDHVPSGTPVRVLRGFEKVQLKKGETREIEFKITRRDVSFWDVAAGEWRIPSGEVVFSVGFSSRDLRVSGTMAFL
jgi:beta-glucosidase